MKKVLFAALLLISTYTSFAGGGWTPTKGEGFFKVGQSAIVARSFFDPSGGIQSSRTLGNYNTSLFAEYGLNKKLSLELRMPFFVRYTLNKQVGETSGALIQEAYEKNYFGDIEIAARTPLYNKNALAIAGTIALGIPTGQTRDPEGLYSGDGEFNQALFVDAGLGLGKFYTTGGIGFNNRTRGFSDEILYRVEAGYKVYKEHLIIFKVFGQESLFNGDEEIEGGSLGLFTNNQEFLSLGPEFIYFINKNTGVSGSVFGALKGRLVSAAPSFNLGVFYKLS